MTRSSGLRPRLHRRILGWMFHSARLRTAARCAFRVPLVGTSLRRVTHSVLPRNERLWVKIPAGVARGLWLNVNPYFEEGYLSGLPEDGVQEVFAKFLKYGGCLYDVGAHIGFYSMVGARLVGEAGKIFAFEPDPSNIALLEENVARNHLMQVTCVRKAVWSGTKIVSFRRGPQPSSGASSRRGSVVAEEPLEPNPSAIRVGAVSLDEFARDHMMPLLIKIDVEGGEVEVIRGASRLLSETQPVLLIEVHHQIAKTFLETGLRLKNYTLEWLPSRYPFPFPRFLLAFPR